MKLSKGLQVWLGLCLALIILSGGCSRQTADNQADFNRQFSTLVDPYTFNFPSWEIRTLWKELRECGINSPETAASGPDTVLAYFSGDRSDEGQSRRETIEKILSGQITRVLIDEKIDIHAARADFVFPPVNFKLEKPPYLLIISPRDRIERTRDVLLKQDISPDQIKKLESDLEKLNVSALVTAIGGLGASYPSFVADDAGLRYTIQTAAEEWLHQYLAFRPLGFHYVLDLLGIKPDPDIDALNETAAGLAAEEIADLVYSKYYAQYPSEPTASEKSTFDFNAVMRETRLKVDAYLAAGQITRAESYMEEQRLFINSHGYAIRKLNQAYFAFYGSYAYSPTSVDPLGEQLRQLRRQSASLRDFLDTASWLTSRQALETALNRK
jgi:hypothetical protein